MAITITRPSEHALAELGVRKWPIWTGEVSKFDWHYDQKETCYFLEGEVTVTAGGEQATIRAGDLAVFPAGMDCVWDIHLPVRKHYILE